MRSVISSFGLAADKRLGQHFLLDPSILRRIAAAAEPLAGRVAVEVGPGPGGLTRALLATDAQRVVAVERDARCIRALGQLADSYGDRLVLVEADARDYRLSEATRTGVPVTLVANLPYNVGTELLLGWLGQLDLVERMVLMFQREVALRLAASPGGQDWGRLGVLAQTLCRVERLFDLPAAAFLPPPKVASSIVRLTPRPDRPAPGLVRALERLTRAAFGQRRKMLRAALRSLVPEPETLLGAVGIAPTRRAETLTLEELHGLAAALLALSPG